VVGIESEMELAYSGLHQLCAPVLDHLDRLPEPQRDALLTVFARQTGPAPSPFLVALATLTLLAEVAEQQPLVCVIDDAQWLDAASAQVVQFVGRRLLAERIALVCAARTQADSQVLAGMPALHVAGLSPSEARALLRDNLQGRFDAAVCDQIVSESHGNPLALLELPRTWNVADVAGGFGLPERHPVTSKIEQSYATRLAALPAETQLLVLTAAAEPLGNPVLLQHALEILGLDMTAAGPAVDARLLETNGHVGFAHPLVRSAAYGSAADEDRRRVHRALAEATDPERDADRRAWHRARATLGRDEAVAAELEGAADSAQARGGDAAAAAFLERAAELTPDPATCARRSLAAAQAKHLAGAPHAASVLVAAAGAGPLDALESALATRLQGEIAVYLQRNREAVRLLVDAARQLEALDPPLARSTHLMALRAGSQCGRLAADLRQRAAAAARRASPPEGEPRGIDLLLAALAVRFTDGYAASAEDLKRALRALCEEGATSVQDPRWPWFARRAALDLFDLDTARALSTRGVDVSRARGALGVLPVALDLLALSRIFDGEFNAADALLQEAEAIARTTHSDELFSSRLTLAGFRGDQATLSTVIETIEPLATERGDGMILTFGEHARALAHNGAGRYEAALPDAESASSQDELAVSVWSLPELVEAAVRCGKDQLAGDALERLSERTRAAGTEWALGIEARSRALIAPEPAAEALYVEAVDRLCRTRVLPELGRARLLYGEWLRRQGRRVDARGQLRKAHDMLTQLGMNAFAERASRELEATGATVRKRRPETRDELTAQEAQIAHLARDGESNSAIAGQLFLSPRTVEWHLRKVFAKLGIKSRTELGSVLRAA
jgi:DNA-binding CsgD family transcriptional regulator